MAIPFLNNINLSDNELQNAKLHIIDTPPTTNAGQIYFDSTSGITTAKYYDGSVWINLVDHAFNNGTYINLTETGLDATRALTADLSAINGVAGVGERYLTKNNTWAEVASIPGTYNFNVYDGTTSTQINSGQTVSFLGTPNETTVVQSGGAVTIGLPNNVTIAETLTVSGTGQSFFAGQVTVPITPSAATDAASKNYVDNAVAGGLIYQGGFDGSTGFVAGTSDYLDNRTGSNQIAVNRGWTYTVTVAGTFYGENVEVGDVLIAEDTLASGTGTLADWTTVQNNIDLASASQVGIGNVVAGTGISISYNGSGTATIANTDTNASNTTTGTITAGNTSGTVTHNWGTLNTIVQTIDSSGDTVFCDISRTTNTVVATIADTQAGDITILVQKIG
jgi:hypothetical protein